MASADDNNAMPPMPALPPIVGIDGQMYEDVVPQLCFGQNLPLAATATRADTTSPQNIGMRLSNQSSAMSSLTTANTSFASVDESKASVKEPTPLLLMTTSHHQKKLFPNFQIAKVMMTWLHWVTILKAGLNKKEWWATIYALKQLPMNCGIMPSFRTFK